MWLSEQAAPADTEQPGMAGVRHAQGAAAPKGSWVLHWVPRSGGLLRATSVVTRSCQGAENEDAALCRRSPQGGSALQSAAPAGHTSMTPGSVASVERPSRSCNFRSGSTALGGVVLLPAPAGWAPFRQHPTTPPTQAAGSVRRKPRQKPKSGTESFQLTGKMTLFFL